MAKKNIEAELILKNIPIEQLSALHEIKGNAKIFAAFKQMLHDMMFLDEGKVITIASPVNSVDDAVKQNSKQMFYQGRINMVVLIHALILNAEAEMERRERKSKNG